MNKILCLIFLIAIINVNASGQQIPNLMNAVPLSPDAGIASNLNSADADIFRGIPQIGIPIFSYSNITNSLSLNITIGYNAGGVLLSSSPSILGAGWYLNAGGIVTRIVRGQPDEGGEYLSNGFRYTDTIPNDWRSLASKYYHDSLDAEQDIFQYNFNGRSGQFYIGKNGQIVQIPVTKMKIEPIMNLAWLSGFKFIDENGIRYDFNTIETTSYLIGSEGNSPLLGDIYNSAWSISRIISPFYTDTIQFNYTTATLYNEFIYPEIVYVKQGDSIRKKQLQNLPGKTSNTINKIKSIRFPDKTIVSFYYDSIKYYSNDQALLMVRIGDPDFKNGFLFEYQRKDSTNEESRLILSSITPITPGNKGRPYQFGYHSNGLPPMNSLAYDTIQRKIDYWGFFNGAENDSSTVPDVDGFKWQANRRPDINYALNGSLENIILPSGGVVNYDFELNDHAAFTKESHNFYFNPATSYSTNATFNQVFTKNHELTFTVDSSISRTGSPPFSGSVIVKLYIKNTAGTVTYTTFDLSLYELFYHGIATWDFHLEPGTYKIEQVAIPGTISGNFPVKLSWVNRIPDTLKKTVQSGGLRIKRITKGTSVNDPAAVITEYKYVNSDGNSSGFLGDVPDYKYPYRETVNYGGIHTTNYTIYSSDPLFNNTAGIAGYSRVEVFRGTSEHNSGKTIYEFTTPSDLNSQYITSSFPYPPIAMREWGLGYPKQIFIYDSADNLIKKTTNNYSLDTSFSYRNKNFRSLKLGNSYTYIDGDSALTSSPRTFTYLGSYYYPETGRIYLSSSTDTIFQKDGSKNTTYSNFVYDSNFNVIKVISIYDKTRGLQLEKRMYYPYNYTIGDGVGLMRDTGIISKIVATEEWITGDASPRILSGNINYYHQIPGGYVLPLIGYSLHSNMPVTQSIIGSFNPSVLNRDSSRFVPVLRINSFDEKGNILEVKNVQSGIVNSTILDYDKRYVIAKITNTGQNDIAYTSFEADGSGNWTISGSQRDTTAAFTGVRCYNLSNGSITKGNLASGITYLISLWSKGSAAVSVNGVLQSTAIETIGDWKFFSTIISGVTMVTISGTGLIDEVRLHPKDAGMATYTYAPMVGITSAADANNAVTYFEYDPLHRKKLIRDIEGNVLEKYEFDDSIFPFDTSPHWVFNRTQCVSGHDGEADSVFIDTNLYSATYNTDSTIRYSNFCTCATASHPEYKIVNNKCELGLKCILSSYRVKIINPDDTYYWTWKCTWRYQWSDGSYTPSYYYYNSSSCPLGCMDIIEL